MNTRQVAEMIARTEYPDPAASEYGPYCRHLGGDRDLHFSHGHDSLRDAHACTAARREGMISRILSGQHSEHTLPLLGADDGECPRCGQTGGEIVCPSCRKTEREPQGEAMRLFAPAPNQITGQMTF